MGIVRFALRFPYTFYVLAALIVFLGATAISVMPTDIFPEIDIPVVSVIWQYTGLSAPEMEQRVTTYSHAQRHLGPENLFPTRRQPRSRHSPDRLGDKFDPRPDAFRDTAPDRGVVQCLERSGAAAQFEL
jgi:hypothetical protein